jgi:hypothetical protein
MQGSAVSGCKGAGSPPTCDMSPCFTMSWGLIGTSWSTALVVGVITFCSSRQGTRVSVVVAWRRYGMHLGWGMWPPCSRASAASWAGRGWLLLRLLLLLLLLWLCYAHTSASRWFLSMPSGKALPQYSRAPFL